MIEDKDMDKGMAYAIIIMAFLVVLITVFDLWGMN